MHNIYPGFRNGRIGSFCADLALDPLRQLLHLRLDLLKAASASCSAAAARSSCHARTRAWSSFCNSLVCNWMLWLRSCAKSATAACSTSHEYSRASCIFRIFEACTLITSPTATTVSCNASCSLAIYVIRTFCASCSREETLCTLLSDDTVTSASEQEVEHDQNPSLIVPDASLRRGLPCPSCPKRQVRTIRVRSCNFYILERWPSHFRFALVVHHGLEHFIVNFCPHSA